MEVSEYLVVRVGHLSELFEGLRGLVPLEGLLEADDDLWPLNVVDVRHRLDGDGGHVAEELADLLVRVQDEEDGADGREEALYAEIRFLLHLDSLRSTIVNSSIRVSTRHFLFRLVQN